MSSTFTRSLATVSEERGAPVSPAVISTIDRFAQGDQTAVRQLARALSAQELCGGVPLPDYLPAVPAILADVSLAGFSTHERRLLLLAALNVGGTADLVLDASGADPGALWYGALQSAFEFDNGALRYCDDRLRSLAVESAHESEIRQAHEALARASRRAGNATTALFHDLQAGAGGSASVGSAIRLAADQLARGYSRGAYRLAIAAAGVADRGDRDQARMIAGRAAFWNGHWDEAHALLRGAASRRDRAVRDTIALIRTGPDADPDPRRRALVVIKWLAEIAEARVDQRAFGQILRAGQLWYSGDVEEADRLNAHLFLFTRQGLSGNGWLPGPDRVTPLAHTQLCVMEAGVQLQVAKVSDATSTLTAGAMTLPLELAGAGVVASFLRAAPESESSLPVVLAQQYDAILDATSAAYHALGPASGLLAAAAASASRSTAPAAPATATYDDNLSPRQREVARLLLQGMTNRTIGQMLGISERTVEAHLHHVFRKAGVRTRSELLAADARSPRHSA